MSGPRLSAGGGMLAQGDSESGRVRNRRSSGDGVRELLQRSMGCVALFQRRQS